MKIIRNINRSRALTLIEISVTIALLLAFTSVVAFSLSGMNSWKLARRASVELQAVYLAQKSYLADHPTTAIGSVAAGDLQPYLPNTMTAIPSVEAIDGSQLAINFNVMPPVVSNGTSAYDPSGSATDGMWDVGRP